MTNDIKITNHGERRLAEPEHKCVRDSVLFRKGENIYCCKCEYTRPAKREEDKKIPTTETFNGK